MSTHQEILVLGGGRVGSAIAKDLSNTPGLSVTVADRSPEALERVSRLANVRTVTADLRDAGEVQRLASQSNLVVGAVPGWMGFATLEAVIEAERNVVDISFFEEDPFRLNDLALAHGVTAVVDCGVAPGLSNLLLGRSLHEFDDVDSFICYVGGLPQKPVAPWCYQAPYSPPDVIEMYTRPARMRRDGIDLTVPALSEPEILQFPGVGRLEAFNTDGLRTPLKTCRVPNMAEKTLRYPGHRDQLVLLEASGFFDSAPRTVNGSEVRPLDLSAKVLEDQWLQREGDLDVTVMRIVVEGRLGGERHRVTYDLCDAHDGADGVSSMARTTGYPCASVVRLIARGDYDNPGIRPPEYLGQSEACVDSILSDLEARGVTFQVKHECLGTIGGLGNVSSSGVSAI